MLFSMKMNNQQSNFVIVRYCAGSGGKFLASYLHSLFSNINTDINVHAENHCNFYEFHNFSSMIYSNDCESSKNIRMATYEHNINLIDISITEKLRKKLKLFTPPQNNFCYIAESHVIHYEKIFGWIPNLKIVNIKFDCDDCYKISENFVKKIKHSRNISYEKIHNDFFNEKKSKISEKELIKKIELVILQRKNSYINDSSSNIPYMDISFKDIFNNKLSTTKNILKLCKFMNVNVSENYIVQSNRLYKNYLNSQSLL